MEVNFLLKGIEENEEYLIVNIQDKEICEVSKQYVAGLYLVSRNKSYLLDDLKNVDMGLMGKIRKEDLAHIINSNCNEIFKLKIKLDFYKQEIFKDVSYTNELLYYKWTEDNFIMICQENSISFSVANEALKGIDFYGYYNQMDYYSGKFRIILPINEVTKDNMILPERISYPLQEIRYSLEILARNNKYSSIFTQYEIQGNELVFDIKSKDIKFLAKDNEVWNIFICYDEDGVSYKKRIKSSNSNILPSLVSEGNKIFEVRAYTTQDNYLGFITRNSDLITSINEVRINNKQIIIKGNAKLLHCNEKLYIKSIKIKSLVGKTILSTENINQEVIEYSNQFCLNINTEQIVSNTTCIEGEYQIILMIDIDGVEKEFILKYNSDLIEKEGCIIYPSIQEDTYKYPLSITPGYKKMDFRLYINNLFKLKFISAQLKKDFLEVKCEQNFSAYFKKVYSTISLQEENRNEKITVLENVEVLDDVIIYNIPIENFKLLNTGDMYKVNVRLFNDEFSIDKEISIEDTKLNYAKRLVFGNLKMLMKYQSFYLGYNNKDRFVIRKEHIFSNGKMTKLKFKLAKGIAKISSKINKQKVWLIGENMAMVAQDNGFTFFEYCLNNGKKEKVFYVSKPNNKDIERLAPYEKNVLRYDSFKHMYYFNLAEYLIVSHGNRDVMPTIMNQQINNNKKPIIYLQHGIIAMKKVFFNKDSYNGMIKKFIVTSEREKDILVKQMNFNPWQVCITGLARFDNLENVTKEQKTILLMPTWREWILDNEEQFIQSEFYIRYKGLIDNVELKGLLKKYNVRLKVYLHIEMQKKYGHLFNLYDKYIEIINLGEKTVQDLLKESDLMITDYSSVALDFNYLRKPVIFYHFDLEEYMYYRGSFIDLNTELPGDVCVNEKELIDIVKRYISNDFKYDEKYNATSELFYDYHDKNNCERIYNEIKSI